MMNYIFGHLDDFFGIMSGIVTVASIIAKLTPTETDNKIVGNLLKIVDLIAINNKPTEIR